MDRNNEVGRADMDLIAKIPPLPEGKTKHFFVSYNSSDKECVFTIVNDLEKRFGLHCVFDERDFQGGKDISVNILEGIKCSLKVLIFLTGNFLRSGWCKYETDAAFVTSMGCGYSCIVPVVLEECEIPPTLVTLTYIDATIPGTDVPAKIASTLLRPVSDDGMFPLNIKIFNKLYENGYCYIISAKRDNVCAYRPAKYYFEVNESLLGKLKEHNVELPESLLVEAIAVVNSSSVMWSFDYLSRCKNFVWSLLLLPIYLLVIGIGIDSVILKGATRERTSMSTSDKLILTYILMSIILPVSFILVQIFLCFVPPICHRKKRDVSLQDKLWRKVGKRCIEHNILLLFTSKRGKLPTLHVMRYNISRCKEYFLGVVKSRNIVPVGDITPEAYVDKLIERHLSETFSILVDDFDYLPDAPYNRHNVKKGKMCICQQLMNNL